MIRLLIFLALVGGFVYLGSTVPLGHRTFFGHVRAIWHTEEVQDLKEGVKEKAAPAARRMKRGIEKGIEAATEDDNGSGSAAAKPAPATP